MKKGILIMLMVLFSGSVVFADWKAEVKRECAITGSMMGPSILKNRIAGVTKDMTLDVLLRSVSETKPAWNASMMNELVTGSVNAVYDTSVLNPFTFNNEQAAKKVQDVCVKTKLKYDPTGKKHAALEASGRAEAKKHNDSVAEATAKYQAEELARAQAEQDERDAQQEKMRAELKAQEAAMIRNGQGFR